MSQGGGRPARSAGVRTWALALALAVLALFVGRRLGAPEHVATPAANRGDTPRTGRWREAAPPAGPTSDEAALLRSLGYASGSEPAPSTAGVTHHDRSAVTPGYNLVVSAHETAAYLLDMEGREIHRWSLDFARVWPGHFDDAHLVSRYWRRVTLLADGGLLAVHEDAGLVRVDRASKVLWKRAFGAHHQAIELPDGRILAIGRRIQVVPRIDPKRPIAEDTLELFAGDGTPLRSISLLEAFERSQFASVLERAKEWGDLFHTNSIQWLDGAPGSEAEPFVAGRVLVSIRELDLLALVDVASARVTWTATGGWRAQHEAVHLPDHRILLFDNRGLGERSRVLELDAKSLAVVWSYGEREGEVFHSKECGVVQRLDDGHTLVTESDRGRAFEITRDGRIVWEFVSPWRAGAQDHLVATLFEVRRVPPAAVAAWLPAPRPPPPGGAVQDGGLPGAAR